MTEVNIPLLRKAVEWAEAEAAKPRAECQWYQRFWVTPAVCVGRDCGTCFCIAGYVGQALDARYADGDWVDDVHVSEFACEALGLDGGAMELLFCGVNTIKDVRRIAEEIAGERL
jgi:hypothetical protein